MILPQPTTMEAASILAISRTAEWKGFADYLARVQRDLDAKLRAAGPDIIGRTQGAAQAVDDLLRIPDTAKSVVKPT